VRSSDSSPSDVIEWFGGKIAAAKRSTFARFVA
jgi:hypothetical protein